MKARKLEFKEVEMSDEVWNASTKESTTVKQGTFSYREIVKQILHSPGPSGSNSSDEVIKSIMVYGKIKDALKSKQDHVLLDKEDYEYLISRLNSFKWAIAHSVVADFISYLRNLPEVDLQEKTTIPSS
jgi:hypothetical protein